MQKEANLEADARDGAKPLHLAAGKGNDTTVQLLLEKGANIGVKRNSGATALHDAVSNGLETTVRLLLARGSDMEATVNSEQSVLQLAVEYKHFAMCGCWLTMVPMEDR
jgi:ankyrin repeat protein